MKFFIVLAVIVSTASAQAILGVATTGRSDVSRSEDGLGNYAFGYNEDHAFGGTFRKEKGGPGVKVGSYGLREADGRMRVVNYVADGLGFRASVSTNEPGTDIKQDPAAVSMNFGHAPVAVAAPAVMAAPAIAAATPVVAKAFGGPLIGKAFGVEDAIMAKAAFDGRFIKAYDTPLMAKAAIDPFMGKAIIADPFMAKAVAVAPITATSYASHTNHIAAPKMIADMRLASPFAKSFVF